MGVRELGNGLGNPLAKPRKISNSPKDPVIFDFTSGSGTFVVPAGFSFVRVSAVGGGAGGSASLGGQGGGLSRSAIVPINAGSTIAYSCGAGGFGQPGTPINGGNSTASFKSITLVGPGGINGATIRNPGYGGVDNWSGGTPANGGGGGAASPLADGTGNGQASTSSTLGGGGGGVLASGGPFANGNGVYPELPYSTSWGSPGFFGYLSGTSPNYVVVGGRGGLWGGGGGGNFGAGSSGYTCGVGGAGGVRIELW